MKITYLNCGLKNEYVNEWFEALYFNEITPGSNPAKAARWL